jgi:vacuolar-type H+-ATPase subunit E/Vma4
MTVDALIARMTRDAQAHIAAVRAGAEAEVAALVEAGARASSHDLEQALAAREVARESAFGIERAAAQRHAAASVLRAQHKFLDRVFARAESLATDASADSRYLQALPRHVANVVGYLGNRPATLRCRTKLAPRLQPLLVNTPQVELIADDTLPAGFIAAARDASCTIDCTLAARLATLRPQLEADLLSRVST